MKIISFRLRGKMAHFRKFYSNSSALSYFIPPRTTISGILAGLLGWERDGYYDIFSLEQCKIAVACCVPVKKTMQKLNYLMIKKEGDFNGSAEHHSQTATEMVIPQNIRSGYLDYQVWISHQDDEIMNKMEKIIQPGFPGYCSLGISLGLGTAFHLGWIEQMQILEGTEKAEDGTKEISSVIPLRKLDEIDIKAIQNDKFYLIKEEIPLEFDKDRRITKNGLGNMVVNIHGYPIPAKTHSCVELSNGQFIAWME